MASAMILLAVLLILGVFGLATICGLAFWVSRTVSRDRFNEKAAEVKELRDLLAQERAAGAKLWNFMVWRMGGVAPDLSALPEAYQPQRGPIAVPPKEEQAQSVQRRRPGQARVDLAQFETERELEFRTKVSGPVPEAQKAVVDELHEAANQVTGR